MEIVIVLAVIGFAGWWFFLKDKESSATPDASPKVEESAPVVSEPVKVEESAPVVETPAPKAGGKTSGKAPVAVARATKTPAKPKVEKKPAAPKAPKAPAKATAPKAAGKAAAPKNTAAK